MILATPRSQRKFLIAATASAQENIEMAALRTRYGRRTNCLSGTTASAAFFAWMMIYAPAFAQSARDTVTVAYSIKSSWETGFSGEITIHNDASWTIGDWALSFRFLPEITSIWNARIMSRAGSAYVIGPADAK